MVIPRPDATPEPVTVSGEDPTEPETQLTPAVAAASGGAGASYVAELRRLYVAGEVDAALEIARSLRIDRIGASLSSIPSVVLGFDQIGAMRFDPRAEFLLARMDGETSLGTLLATSPLNEDDAMTLVEDLVSLGVIRLEAARTVSGTVPRFTGVDDIDTEVVPIPMTANDKGRRD